MTVDGEGSPIGMPARTDASLLRLHSRTSLAGCAVVVGIDDEPSARGPTGDGGAVDEADAMGSCTPSGVLFARSSGTYAVAKLAGDPTVVSTGMLHSFLDVAAIRPGGIGSGAVAFLETAVT